MKKTGKRGLACAALIAVLAMLVPVLAEGACEHAWALVNSTKATCTEAGEAVYRCEKCGEEKRETIPATGHQWAMCTMLIEPTCTEDGVIRCFCSNDPAHYEDKVQPAAGHQWGDWVTVKEPAPGEDGREKRECSKCGETQWRKIAAPEIPQEETRDGDAPDGGEAAAAEDPETCPGTAGAEETVLQAGDKGEDVLEIKKRLQKLRYFNRNAELTYKYTEATAEAVAEFQKLNGLPETGKVDGATREKLFSGDAVKKPYPAMPPLAEQEPKPEPDWPERDAEGFLAGEGEYVYENDEAGLWAYLSATLQITITRNKDESIPLAWFETEIRTRGDETFRTVQTDPERPGKKFQYPDVIAEGANLVLGFTDDFFASRISGGETVGIIIRDGEIISKKTRKKTSYHLPNLDMMAQFPDGSLQVYECNEKTAEELQEAGAVNVLSFGPILIRNGEINELVYLYYRSLEPRQALGMIEPNHYLLLSVQGRNKESKGCALQRVAEMMQARGVTQALNLDGGNTMALVFRGRMLNKLAVFKNRAFVRTVTSLIGVGKNKIQN